MGLADHEMGAQALDLAARTFLASRMPRKLGGSRSGGDRDRDRDDDDDDRHDDDYDSNDSNDSSVNNVSYDTKNDDNDDVDRGSKRSGFFAAAANAVARTWTRAGPAGKIAFVIAALAVLVLLFLAVRAAASCCCGKKEEENAFESLESPATAQETPSNDSGGHKQVETPVETTPVQPYVAPAPAQHGAPNHGVPAQPYMAPAPAQYGAPTHGAPAQP